MMLQNKERFLEYLQQNYQINNIEQIYPPTVGKSNIFFKGNVIETDNKIFIKYDMNYCGSSTREAQILQLPKFKNSPYFSNVICYEDNDFPFVAFEFIEGIMLNDVLSNLDLRYELLHNKKQKKRILLQLIDIMKILDEEKIVHRDIHPKNIIVTRNRNDKIDKLILIDFSFSVGVNRFPELPYLIASKRLKFLGTKYYKPETYKWDNQYSIAKIATEIEPNCDKEFPDIWNEIYSFKEKLIYKLTL
ncbi:protein kinase domain-containing protein [Wukongibacter sp. M2B1]|uniref:protein kinase domain-containing protein n=1 Tax=Wukongibacter sp. M2B1 TaxID=3088895 RepID=UPI003D7AF54C